MTDTERDFGQGSYGGETAAAKKKVSFGTRLNSTFDNALSSKKRFVGLIFIAMIILAFIMTGIQALIAAATFLNETPGDNLTYFDVFWESFSKILSLGGEATWGQRIIGVLYWAIAIAVTGTVIGFITSLIQQAMARLGKGISPVVESGHTLILGWSPRVFPILKELSIAKSSEASPVVVVFADQARDVMEEQIASRAGDLGKLKVITRRGSLSNPADVARANVGEASSIIVLDSDEAGDAGVVTTVLAIRANAGDNHPPVIAELDDVHTAATLNSATGGRVRSVRSQDVIARVTAQAARQPGLASVILDLLDFEGNELYYAPATELEGKTYGDALLAFDDSAVIGFQAKTGELSLNPAATTTIPAGAKLIVIAEDDSTIKFTGVKKLDWKTRVGKAKAVPAQNLLVVGWSAMGRAVLGNLAEYLPKGSSITILARNKFVAAEELKDIAFGNVKVSYSNISGDVAEVIAVAERHHYDEIIVLGYRNAMTRVEADAQTLLTMMQMNQLFEDDSNKVKPTRIVAEILDSSLLPLARVAAADDLVVSDVLAALLISQLSQNPGIAPVFEDLFDADGAAIHLSPVENYVPTGQVVSFAELVAAGRAAGQSVIGYRSASAGKEDASKGVSLNPSKSVEFTTAAGDSLIVIASE